MYLRRKKNYFKQSNEMPPPVTVRIERQLQFNEVDILQIAWHGHYAKFFEQANAALGDKIGLSYQEYGKHRLGAPIVQLHIDYYRPLKLSERFTVEARLIWSDAAKLNTEYTITCENGQLACCGYTVQMLIDLETREPHLFAPPLLEQCRQRWLKGEFA